MCLPAKDVSWNRAMWMKNQMPGFQRMYQDFDRYRLCAVMSVEGMKWSRLSRTPEGAVETFGERWMWQRSE